MNKLEIERLWIEDHPIAVQALAVFSVLFRKIRQNQKNFAGNKDYSNLLVQIVSGSRKVSINGLCLDDYQKAKATEKVLDGFSAYGLLLQAIDYIERDIVDIDGSRLFENLNNLKTYW